MKKTLVFITLLALIAVAAAGCAGSRAEQGPALSHNVARIWFPAERTSRFALDGKVIEGEVTGQAFMDASADGRTSIAWVDTTPYFVSESGVDQLGAGIDVAVVSFDGRYAVYLTEGELRMFSVETRDCTVLMEGVASAQQIAVSPKSESVLFTVSLEGEGVTRKTFLYAGGSVQEVYEGRGVIAIAVSDDASVRYFFDFKAGAFCADVSGEERVISEKCDNNTNYNFTNDLSEVAFRDTEGENHWYRLRDGRMTDLGGGFDYTLKTDIYSMSTTTLIAYINDVSSFTNGLWLVRSTVEGSYLYGVGLIGAEGELTMLVENAVDFKVGGGRIVWMTSGRLCSTNMRGKTKELAMDVVSFTLAEDGEHIYYLSNANSLFGLKGTGKPTKLDSSVSAMAEIAGNLLYIKDAKAHGDEKIGTLCRLTGLNAGSETDIPFGAEFDKRWGQLIIYAYPAGENGEPLLETAEGGSSRSAYVTPDGLEFTLVGEGAEG